MTFQTPPDSWPLFAEWLPSLAPGRWRDPEVFERSNKRLNRVSGSLISVWTQRCAGQPTVAGTTVGISGAGQASGAAVSAGVAGPRFETWLGEADGFTVFRS
jgi:hypothetical protein